MEVTAPATGVVAEILISDGGEAEKGALLGRITVDASAALPAGADVPVARPAPRATVTNAPLSRSAWKRRACAGSCMRRRR